MTYDEAIEWLLSFADFERSGRFQDRPDVAPMLALLERLGNPHLGPATVHIAGIEGEGQRCRDGGVDPACGWRHDGSVHEPAPCTPTRERIRVNRRTISPRKTSPRWLTKFEPAVEDESAELGDRQLVTFDLLTALAFLAFAKPTLDVQVIEVGLGGRVDSTNVFETKEVAVITPISLEHTAILGDTIEKIAREKAAIITPGCTRRHGAAAVPGGRAQ